MAFNSIYLLSIIVILHFATIGVSSPLISLYLQELGASYDRIALILASFAATSLLTNYLWGWLSDKTGRRKPLIVAGLVGLVVAYAWLSQARTVEEAWWAWVLEGACRAAYLTPSLALMGDLLATGNQRGRRMGLYRGLGSLAFGAAAVVGGRLADLYSLHVAFQVCVLFNGLAVIVALFLRETGPAARVTMAKVAMVAKRPLPFSFLAGVFLWIASWSAFTSMWPNFMDTLGYSKTAISSLWGLAALVEAPAMWLGGAVSDVIGRVPLLITGSMGIMVIMAGYILVSRWLPALMAVQTVRGVVYASYTPTTMTFASEWGNQEQRGGDTGLYYAVNGAGQLLGLFAGGRVVQAFQFETLFVICAVAGCLSGLCFWLLRRERQREQSIVVDN
jgi:PPP family 3-phenylpropionic acid transporter